MLTVQLFLIFYPTVGVPCVAVGKPTAPAHPSPAIFCVSYQWKTIHNSTFYTRRKTRLFKFTRQNPGASMWSEEKRKTNTKSFDNSSWFHSSQLPKTTTLLKYSEFFGFFSPSLIELFLIYAYVHLRCRVWWADTHVYCEMITKTMLTPSFFHVIIIMCVCVCVCVCWWHLRSILLTGLKYVIQLILVLMLPIKPPEFIHL